MHDDFEQLVVRNCFPSTRVDSEWEKLIEPDQVEETRETLLCLLEGHMARVLARKQEWAQTKASGFLSDYSQRYAAWRDQTRRDSYFTLGLQSTITEINEIVKDYNIQQAAKRNLSDRDLYRRAVFNLASAIREYGNDELKDLLATIEVPRAEGLIPILDVLDSWEVRTNGS